MELMQYLELSTPVGIATITTILVELVKKQFLPGLDKSHKLYSLIIMGLGFAVAGIMSWVAVPMLDLSVKDALYNWVYGWVGATFGFQLIKGAAKVLKK